MSERDRGSSRPVTRRKTLAGIVTTTALGALSPGLAAAGRRADAVERATVETVQSGEELEYVVKVVCGVSEGEVVAPGEYWTAINVHNPHEEAFQFRWKVALAEPREAGQVSDFEGFQLGPDEAFEIDCPHVRELADGDERLVKGFLVLQSVVELDVTAVYTAAGGDGTVRTIQVVNVPPSDGRRDGGDTGGRLPDLVPAVPSCDGVVVRVTNQGAAPAGASTTEVDYGRYGTQTAETPPLGPGESETHQFVPPLGCHDPDCDFTVTVDADEDVVESDEANNVLQDVCIG